MKVEVNELIGWFWQWENLGVELFFTYKFYYRF